MIARFFSAMGFFGRGWRLAFAGGGLTTWVLMPALVTIAASGGGSWLTYHYVREWLLRHGGGHGVGAVLAWIAVVLVVAMTAYVLYAAAAVLATAPFAGVLSERAEQRATGKPVEAPSFARALALALRGAGQALLGIVVYLSIALPLFALHWLLPAVAPFVWIASLVQTALFFAFDAFNEPLHRRGASFGRKWRFVGAHLAESLGFGLVVALCMMIPLVSVVVAPVSVVGGTLLYLDIEGRQARKSEAGKKKGGAGV